MSFSIHPNFRFTHDGNELSITEIARDFPEIDEFLSAWNSPADWIELQTSGSTGSPKTIRVLKSVLWHSAGATIYALNLPPLTTALLALPVKYVAGRMMIVRAMRGGWSLAIQSPSTQVLNQLKCSYDFAALIPMQVELGIDNLNRIGSVLIGGAPVSLSLRERLVRCGNRVYESYGMTETVSHIALKEIAPNHDDFFRALPGVHFSTNKENCLVIHAPQWGHSELLTTDVVELIGDNRFLWKGRADFVINSGGLKIHPEPLEEQLELLWNQEVYIVGVPDDILGTKAVAVVEELVSEPKQFGQINPLHVPKEVLEIESFPRTGNGKIDRRALVKWASSQ